MKENNRTIYIINEEGIRQDAEIIAKFKLSNNFNYIVYTYGEINDNDMIKIYSTGIVGQKGNYNYKEIDTNSEWDEIKNILKILAKDENSQLPEMNKSNLTFIGEEISVRKPKKLLVSNKFAKVVANKYNENSSNEYEEEVTKFSMPFLNEIKEEKNEEVPNVKTNQDNFLTKPLTEPSIPSSFSVPNPQPVVPEIEKQPSINNISVPTFEELQARSKKVSEVIENSKPEFEVKNDFNQPENVKIKREDYTQKFKSEVEPVLLDVYSKQQAQIDALEEELSKTKYNLFEEQKLSLSLKSANKELAEKGNRLENELSEAQAKVDGIMNLLQGNK